MSEKLPAIDWIKRIVNPEIRERALRNIENIQAERGVDNSAHDNFQSSLISAFNWSTSPEGFDYWDDLYDVPPELLLPYEIQRERDEKLLREFVEWFRRTQVANIFIDEGEITDFLNQKYKQ